MVGIKVKKTDPPLNFFEFVLVLFNLRFKVELCFLVHFPVKETYNTKVLVTISHASTCCC